MADEIKIEKKKKPVGNPNWGNKSLGTPVQSGNPGGVVPTEKKPFRKVLLKIFELPATTTDYKPATIGEEMAWRMIQNARVAIGSKESIAAVEAIANRLDGREQRAGEEEITESVGNKTKILLIGEKKATS